MATAVNTIAGAESFTSHPGQLFHGLSFFLLQRIPLRSKWISEIQSNGGRIVKFESQADYIIADHMRRDAPPNSLSYTFIEAALRDHALPDVSDHPAGQAMTATQEAERIPSAKPTRTPFTPADDDELKRWVETQVRQGFRVKGNDMYVRLAAANPRHTFHAWRDRYIKKLMDKHVIEDFQEARSDGELPSSVAEGTGVLNRVGLPDAGQDSPRARKRARLDAVPIGRSPSLSNGFTTFSYTQDDVDLLVHNGKYIEKVAPGSIQEAWSKFALSTPHHTASEWIQIWNEVACPAYQKQKTYSQRTQDSIPPSKQATDHVKQERNISTARLDRPRLKASNGESSTAKSSAAQLSEENLASLRRQYAVPSIRGNDLLKDDDAQDQTNFALYLQDTLGVEKSELQSLPNQKIAVSDEQTHAMHSKRRASSKHAGDKSSSPPGEEPSYEDSAAQTEFQSPDVQAHAIAANPMAKTSIEANASPGPADLCFEFAVPSPDGGFDYDNEGEQDFAKLDPELEPYDIPKFPPISSVQHSRNTTSMPRRQALETQDILRSGSAELDLAIPPVSLDFAENIDKDDLARLSAASSKKRRTTQSHMEDTVVDPLESAQELGEDDLESWITQMSVRGFPEDSVLDALRCSSMRPDLGILVLLKQRGSGQFPNDTPGIWSLDDDRALEGTDGRQLKLLEQKHGSKECAARMQFLAQWRDTT